MALNARPAPVGEVKISTDWQFFRRTWPSLLDGTLICLLFIASLWIYRTHTPWLITRFNPYDLGIASYNAIRVGSGYVPYVDLYLMYGPGSYYLRALLFAIFGASIATMQGEITILCAACVSIGYWGMRASVGRITALGIALTLTPIVLIAFPFHAATYCSMLLAVGCLAHYAARRHHGWLTAAGIAIGITGAGRWDFGAYLAVIAALTLCCLPVIRARTAPTLDAAPSERPLLAQMCWMLILACLTALPVYLPTLLTDPGAFLRAIAIARAGGVARGLPYPTLPNPIALILGNIAPVDFIIQVLIKFPAYAFPVLGPLNILLTITVLRLPMGNRPPISLIAYTITMTLCSAALFSYGHGRPDLSHTAPMTAFVILSLPLLAWCLSRPRQRISAMLHWLRWGVLAVALAVVLSGFSLSYASLVTGGGGQSSTTSTFAAPQLSGLVGSRDKVRDYDALIRDIQQRTRPDQYIFSGLTRHDRIYVNDVLLYFAADRQAGVRDYHMDPGTTNTREIQQRIIHDLQANGVRLIVLADLGLSTEPNGSRDSSGVTDLDEYIRANYVVVEQYGNYSVLLPRTEVAVSCAIGHNPDNFGAIESVVMLPVPGAPMEPVRLLRITGWAATPDDAAPLSAIEVRVNNRRVPAVQQCLPRDDIAARLGQSARYSGFMVTVDPRDVPDFATKPLDVAVDVIDRDGQHHPLHYAAPSSDPAVAP